MALVSGLFLSNTSNAQFCSAATDMGTLTPTIPVQTVVGESGSFVYWSFNTTAGCTYNFNTCTAFNDTYLRLYDTATGGAVLASSDDDCNGAASTITYTETVTTTRSILLTNYSCSALTSATTMSYSTTCSAGPTVTLVPFSGNNSVTCGSNVTLQDHAGTSNYATNANGYTVLNAANSAVINIAGSYDTESSFDFITIYNGSGTGGAVVFGPVSGNSTINYTGAPGQTLTVGFTSDGSVEFSGFDLAVTYSGSCLPPVTLVPFSGNNSVACGTNTVLQDHAGSGSYSNNANGYTVLNALGGAVISISGTFGLESCCDHLYIRDGSGTGGAILAQNVGGSGTISYTGTAGQTLTVQFTSDGSVVGTGLDLNVSYTGSCAVACTQPTPAVSNVTTSSADVSWTCAGCTGQYIVEYGPTGFTPGTGGTAGAGGTIWTGGAIAASPVTITGLTALTGYSVYVRQECTPGTLYSVNAAPVNFTTACAGTSCNYILRFTDQYGDGWNGGAFQILQNGASLGTFGTANLSSGCGPVDVPVSICSGSTISLVWTSNDTYTEDGLRLYDPFGVLVYSFKAEPGYDNCGNAWTSPNGQPNVPGTLMYSGTTSCTPPACVQPATVSTSGVTGTTASVDWTCTSCTGVFYVEYGPTGYTPGTGAAAGTGTLVPGGPFVAGPVNISGLSGSTAYTVHVRQECSPGVFSSNTGTNFTTGIDCATSPTLACATPTSITLAGTGAWNPAAAGGGPYSTPGQERLWLFTAPNAGTYTLNVTSASFGTYIDYFFKAAPGTCDQTGWTFIRDFFGTGTQDFTIPAAGTYYILADEESTVSVSQTFNITCPLPCATPTALFLSDVTSVTATANWTCASCTGSQFFVEVGAPGFIPGTGNTAGGGTVYGPFATSPGAITGLVPTTSYEVYVRQDCNNVGDAYSNNRGPVFFTTLAPPPANDDCVNAIPVACGDVITGSNVAATTENLPSQAAGGEATVDNGVWYVYTPTVTGEQVTASLCAGTSFDTRIHIFQGSCASPVGVAGADDVCGVQSSITWNALPGNTYYIVVEGYFSSSGTFQMTVSCGPLCNPLVANDLCINAQAITMDPNCVPFGGNLSCATNTAGANPSCVFNTFGVFNDAYYTFQATAPDAFVTLTNGGTSNLHFVIYNGAACDVSAINQVYCSAAITSGAPTLVTGLTTGNFYTMRVMQLATGAGPFTLCVQKLDISDNACTPVALACGDLRFGRTVGRSNNIPAGACPFNGAASTGGVNFFSYTAAADEDVTFSLCGQTNFDTRLSVFEGACTALTCNVMNDDAAGCPGGGSEVTLRAVNGQTYTVMVHGAGALEGTYQLSVFCNPYCAAYGGQRSLRQQRPGGNIDHW